MKFLFTAPRFHTNLYYPIKSILDHGHEVEFLALYEGQSEAHDLVKPIILGSSRFKLPPILLFLKLFIYSQASVVVVKDIVTPYSLLALSVGWLLRKKIIVLTQIPKFRNKKQSGSVRVLEFFGIPALTPVLGDSRFTNSNHNLIYIPFVIESSEQLKSHHSVSEEIVILCVGKYQDRKRQLLLMQAVNRLRSKFSLRLLLSGEENELEYLTKIRNYIKNNQLESVVSILKHMPWKEMGALYKQADLFVLPSVGESAAYSILEAMGYGLPVISSDDNGTQWYVRNGENGFVFKKDDLTDLIDKIEKIISNHNNLKMMGQKSLSLAIREHHPEVFYDRLMEIIGCK